MVLFNITNIIVRSTLSLFFVLCCFNSIAQDTATKSNAKILVSQKVNSAISERANSLSEKITSKSNKYLKRLLKYELKLYPKLKEKDTSAANELFADITSSYDYIKTAGKNSEQLLNKFNNHHLPYLDSVKTAINFLSKYKEGNIQSEITKHLNGTGISLDLLQSKINYSDKVQGFIKERKQLLIAQSEEFGLSKEFKKIKQLQYYYQQQIIEYKEAFKDPKILEKRAIENLAKIPAFQEFFNKNSELASLFQLPGNNPLSSTQLTGLQTRTSVMSQITTTMGSSQNINQAIKENLNQAQNMVNDLKNKVNQLGGGGNSDMEIPDFKVNNQKTKRFLNRIELGTNFQSQKGNSILPAITDIGLSVGYKINDKSVIGFGGSYKLGWGNGISNIRFSSEGMGLRSFIDWKIKGNIWLSGGAEANYKNRFDNIDALKNYTAWQRSILIGFTKKFQATKKLKGNIQLLFDGLYNQHMPITQPIIFRIGYTIK